MTPHGEIDQMDVQVDGPNEKRLMADKRKLEQKTGKKGEQDFTKEIGSIQIMESPMKPTGEERDSMVLLGSKNFEKNQPKKKSKKIGGTGNLKKNKLAIAFNNLENAGED